MKLFKTVCDENRQFLVVLGNPIVRHHTKLGILKKTFEKNVHPVTFSIFNLLTKKNRENLIYSIAEEFDKLYNLQKGSQKVTVTSVTPLTDAQKAEFIKIVGGSTGKQIVLEEKVEEPYNYWKERCLAAEKFIDLSPCDPDIHGDQWIAHNEWEKIKSKQTN